MLSGDILILLLQVQVPTRHEDFWGDTLQGLLGQIPAALIIQICLAGSLLVAAIVYFTYVRRRRAAAKQLALSAAADSVSDSEPAPVTAAPVDTGDMPDLDLLLDQSSLAREMPQAPPPAPVPAVAPARLVKPDSYTLNLHNGQTAEAQEVLSILRDTDDGRLIVQMGDTAYRTLIDVPDAKKQFTQIMRELSEGIVKPDDRAAVSTPPEPEPVAPAAPEPLETTPAAETVPEDDIPSLSELIQTPKPASKAPPPPVTPEGEMPGDLPSFKLDDHPVKTKRGRLGGPKFEAAPIPELNIAAAIEAYLQHKLRHTQAYPGRGIHVRPAPGGGVRIQVDNQFYEAVGDVAEPDVREFLAETIQEWQDRQ